MGVTSDFMIVVGELLIRNQAPMHRASHQALLVELRGVIQRIDWGI